MKRIYKLTDNAPADRHVKFRVPLQSRLNFALAFVILPVLYGTPLERR